MDTINYWILDKNYAFFGHSFLNAYYDGNGQSRYFNHLFWKDLVTRDK